MSAGAYAWAAPRVPRRCPIVGWALARLQRGWAKDRPGREWQSAPPSLPSLGALGGPMSASDYELSTAVEDAGGHFVLDATERASGSCRGPRFGTSIGCKRIHDKKLVRSTSIASQTSSDARTNRMFAWLREQVAQRHVRGILLRRYVSCDHWHGEMQRLREELAVPTVGVDNGRAGNDSRARAR